MTEDPRFCSCCGRGPFSRMQGHLKKCQAAIQQGREVTDFFQELKREGRLPVVEPFWKRSSVRGESPHEELGSSNLFQDNDSQTAILEDQTEAGEYDDFIQALDDLAVGDMVTGDSNTGQDIPSGGSTDLPRRSGRVIRPTWKVVESQLEPPTVHIDPPPPPKQRVMLLVRKLFSRIRNTFGLSRTYKGVPSSIPNLPNSESFIPSYVHPVPSREPKTIEEIIDPYPNLTSFLFDYHFWTSGPTKSRRDRDATQELLIREDFKPSDLKGVNFNVLEQEVRGYSSTGQWEQTCGWRKSDLAIGFPLGVKKMTEVRRAEAAQAARLRCRI